MSLNPYKTTMTMIVRTEPEDVGGGNYMSKNEQEITIRAVFIPHDIGTIITTPSGDLVGGMAEIQLRKKVLDDYYISASNLVTRFRVDNRVLTVVSIDDYTHINGCYVFYVLPEVDKDTY